MRKDIEEPRNLMVFDQDSGRKLDSYTPIVAVVDGPAQLLHRKIPGINSGIEFPCPQIDRIGSIGHCGEQALPIARR